MTSLELFRPPEHTRVAPTEWGTGKYKEQVDLWVPRNATWNYTGEPIKQHYGLTQLKLSNVRSNDELVPRPQALEMGREMPNKSFPAEHPYQSHIPRFAVFPKFDSPEDPKRGVAARSEQPISSEMPAQPYDITVKEKTKGSGLRYEYQALPTEGGKTALYWPGEDFFDQQVKVHGGRQQFYPIPPKTFTPNLQSRDSDMRISAPSANALRNVERAQWITSHSLDYTGLGPSNPLALDNVEEKYNKLITTGEEDDKLYPHFINTFDPPRGMEGRLARKITPAPPKQRPLESGTTDNPGYKRKMTLSEREEHRLLHGTEYVNLPDTSLDPARDIRWRELDLAARAGPSLEKIEKMKREMEDPEDPYPQAGTPPPPEESYLNTAKTRRDLDVQEIEAQNRWKVLELQSPSHDQTALNKKMEMLKHFDKEHPGTFYNHEGRYNEERAGLYKTSYDPHRLAGNMNSLALSAPEVMYTLDSNEQAQTKMSLQAARLGEDTREALKWSRTFSLSQPDLSGDRQDAREALQPYTALKHQQRTTLLPPGPHQARPLVQEKELLQREATTMGDSYNVKKFLQENTLDKYARSEPLGLMSSENQSLSRVRSRSVPRSSKSVQFSKSVTVATMSPNSTPPLNVGTQPLSGEEFSGLLGDKVKVNTTQYTSTQALYRRKNDGGNGYGDLIKHSTPAMFDTHRSVTFASEVKSPYADFTRTTSAGDAQQSGNRSAHSRRPSTSHGHLDSEYTDQFRSLSSNFAPTGVKHTLSLGSSYDSQFPIYDLSYKKDPRFDWEPGCGTPRPQTSLLRLQESFVKSDVRKRFHSRFSETNPELRFNIATGKKHNFFGFNAQVIHG